MNKSFLTDVLRAYRKLGKSFVSDVIKFKIEINAVILSRMKTKTEIKCFN